MKGVKRELLTTESILNKITPYDIYRYYIGKDFQLNKAIHSPIPWRVKSDDNPSFLIGSKYDNLYHIDFGDSRWRGNCFDFVEQMCQLDFNSALQKINEDFGLGIGGRIIKDYKKTISDFGAPPIIKKASTIIQVKSKKFDQSDLNYWNQYGISEEDLKRENIYSIKDLWLNKEKFPVSRTELIFGYLYDDKWKIYRPFAKDKKQKWFTNVAHSRMDGLENIKNCNKAIITKSKKDKIVISKIFPCVCSVQAESVAAINEKSLLYLKENSKEQYINFDSDLPGKKNSWIYTTEFGMKHINVPDEYLYNNPIIKDFADLAKYKGLKTVEEFFKLKNLL